MTLVILGVASGAVPQMYPLQPSTSNSNESTQAKPRREWIAALDKIESLTPRAVIAGHKRPGNDDSPKILEETRQYIRDFDRVAGTTATARGLYDKMLELYPDRVNPGGALWLTARAVKP
jgi:hypothetical protein